MIMNKILKPLCLAAALLLAALPAGARITLSNLFTDHMVLQQKSEVKIWGTASPHKTVSVTPSWNGITYNAHVGKDGKWSVRVSTPAAGGPYTVNFTEGRRKTAITLKDVLIGEVWICTGQSNMEMRVGDGITGMADELENAASLVNVRLLHIKNAASPHPLENCQLWSDGWVRCNAETLRDFSAAGYFFGKVLNEKLDVPVGLIETCWGGTVAEAWTDEGSLRDMPDFIQDLEYLKQYPDDIDPGEYFEKDLALWEEKMAKVDPGFENGKPVWAMRDYDDSSWTEATTGYLQPQGIKDMNGYFWMRKTVKLPDSWAGKPLKVHLGNIDDYDFSYLNGVRIGHMESCIFRRDYEAGPGVAVKGLNTVAIRVMDTGGMSGIMGDDSSLYIEGPDGGKVLLTGTWKVRCAFKSTAMAPTFPVNMAVNPNFPSILYNAMINPLIDYKIRGAIWYQGESNTSKADQYKDLLPLMITGWRAKWGYDFPFIIAQIANYMDLQRGPEDSDWARLREAQLETLRLDNTGLAVLIDIGEEKDIHPKNKKDVGYRLALNALHGTYGMDTEYQGPLYAGYSLEKGKVRVRFTHTTGGIVAKGDAPEGFYIAGADHVFHKADAVIDGDSIVVSSPEVRFPVAVRYAWANNPVCNIFNGFGLPASPFRTDTW